MCSSKASHCKQSHVIWRLRKSLLTDLLLTPMLLHWQPGKHSKLDKALDEIACGKWRGFLLFPGTGKSRPCSESMPYAFKASAYTVGSKASNEHLQYHPYPNTLIGCNSRCSCIAVPSIVVMMPGASPTCSLCVHQIRSITLPGLYAPPSHVSPHQCFQETDKTKLVWCHRRSQLGHSCACKSTILCPW